MAEITIKDLKQRHIEEFLAARRAIRNDRMRLTPKDFGEVLATFAVTLAKKELKPEQYATALDRYVQGLGLLAQQREELSGPEEDGLRVRAAARCGWFGNDMTEDGVGDLAAWEVDALSNAVTETFNAAYEIPKN